MRWMCIVGVIAITLSIATSASAANILFVADASQDDVNIPAVLTGDGHTVSVVTGDYNVAGDTNTVLGGDGLAPYDAIFWNASGSGAGGLHHPSTTTNLASYVSGGGYLFVTGYDSTDSPDDPNLRSLLGASSGSDGPFGEPSAPLINVANSLTVGVVDIRGVNPSGGGGDFDTLLSLGGGAVAVRPYSSGAMWTLRTLGSGEVAYVSNGASSGEHASWLNTSAGGAGAYNAALRNFADAAGGTVVPVPAAAWLGLSLLGGLGITRRLRRRTR